MHFTVSRIGARGLRSPAMEGSAETHGAGSASSEPTLADDEAVGEDGAPGSCADGEGLRSPGLMLFDPDIAGGGVMPTVISKMGPERVRRRVVPRTSPIREAMSPGL